jgi:translation initiation factor IF-2
VRRAPERPSAAPQRSPEAPRPPAAHTRAAEVEPQFPREQSEPDRVVEEIERASAPVAIESAPEPAASAPVPVPVAVAEPAPAPAVEERMPAAPPAAAPVAAQPAAPVEIAPPPPPVRRAPEPVPAPARPQAPAAAAAPANTAAAPAAAARPRPKTGIEVGEGRAGVPMPQPPRTAPRRVQYDAKSGTAPAAGGRPRPGMIGGPGGRMGGGPQGRNARHRGIGSLSPKRAPGAPPVTQERSAHKKIVKIESTISLQNLAAKMGAKAGEVLMKLLGMGMTGVNINSNLDPDTAKIVANEFGWEVEDVAVSDEDRLVAAQTMEGDEAQDADELLPRPPVVTVMGHVDHGKTSLLDYLRKSQVTEGEAGGITQHIGAYSVETARGAITFLDTPGHAAFTAMRARGAQTTDIVVLVVAADDGVMPQTKEAVSHARSAKVPIVVAVNKIDKDGAQPDRVRRELSELGLVPEEWGGDTLFCECSAMTGQGVDKLLENLVLQSDLLELKANPNKPASGVVIEAKLDRGQGPVATVLVQTGTLKRGDVVLVGGAYGKIRAMLDDHGRTVNKAGPSTPVAIIGLSDVPQAGDPIHTVKSLKEAQEIAESRRNKNRGNAMSAVKKVSLEELARRMSQADQLEVKLIIKADVQGSVEALSSALNDLSTEKVKVTIVHSGVGAITEGDVNLAIAAKAIVVGFNVRPAGKAGTLAQKEGIEIRQYSIIYDVTDDIKSTMEGLLAPTLVEKLIGKAEVRKLFKVSKANVIAGCMVIEGLVRRNAGARLLRDSGVIWQGKIASLKRFKDDAREVKEGFDCGISLDGFGAIEEGDIIEAMETEEVRQTL